MEFSKAEQCLILCLACHYVYGTPVRQSDEELLKYLSMYPQDELDKKTKSWEKYFESLRIKNDTTTT